MYYIIRLEHKENPLDRMFYTSIGNIAELRSKRKYKQYRTLSNARNQADILVKEYPFLRASVMRVTYVVKDYWDDDVTVVCRYADTLEEANGIVNSGEIRGDYEIVTNESLAYISKL